jgi:hypothetical protein
MKLVQKATAVVRGLKHRKQTGHRGADGHEYEQSQILTEKGRVAAPKRNHPCSLPASTRPFFRGSTDRVIATALGKRRRTNMGHPAAAIAIHEDHNAHENHPQSQPRRLRKMSAQDTISRMQEDHIAQDESMADDDTDSEDEVDESVMEDMRQLEASFTGISQKYRLINRIGEGQSRVYPFAA